MRTLVYVLATFSMVSGVLVPCLAQQSRPVTLENLLNSEVAPASDSAATPNSSAAAAIPERQAGTVARPQDGVQHLDLDVAWAEYDAVVSQAADGIKAVIAKQFDVATQKGDLDAAEKWQAALEKFEKAGEVPAEAEVNAIVKAAVTDYKKAKDKLAKTYESLVKNLTTEKKIAEAKAARDEWRSLQSDREQIGTKDNPRPTKVGQGSMPLKNIDLLAATNPTRDSLMGRWIRQADGSIAFDSRASPNGKLEIPFKPTVNEYDLLAAVDVVGGARHVVLYVVCAGQTRFFIIKPFAAENIEYVRGAECELAVGKTHQIVVQVRNELIKVFVDGQRVAEGTAGDMPMNDYWKLQQNGVLGVGSHESSLVFRALQMHIPRRD